ncbi:hypothetical protein B0186_07275 [Canicola haemoglobinophilus]|uniref:Type I restriction/modification specificity protein n=1 Tax=Canicola haemoglobinophilus TaxID=733 RepID=A0A1V4B0H2_9PAST|nr:restriction endonuclease subunit S [Canicola haemoglobinophilus]OOR99692.1 hypothetical protein B0186_07275 [Canicola haemoglobinophilus]STO59033.1 type I restriction/modification specificity protein [Canicola haemoglobinophilus]
MSKYSINQLARNVTRKFDFEKFKRVIFINTGDVLNNEFLHQNVSSKNSLPGQAKKAIKKGDILYSEIRPGNGRYLLVEKDLDNYVVSTKFMVIEVNKELVLPEYLYLILTSQEVVSYFKVIAESRSGTFPQITFDSISHYSIDLPNLEIQKEIIDIVFAFNKKIQLNTQINQTLEQIAQAIFKSWFIDFDPVKAKAEAKAQGTTDEQANIAAMSVISGKSPDQLNTYKQTNPTDYQQLHQLAQAFPSEFEEIDGVEIPKGWGIVSIVDKKVLEIIKPRIDIFDGEKEYIATANVSGNSIVGDLELISYENRPSRANMQPVVDSIWFAKMVGEHKAILIDKNDSFLINRTILSTGFMGLRPKENRKCFLYCYINSEQFKQEKNQLATGAVQIALNNGSFSKMQITLPADNVLVFFENKLSDIFSKISENHKENKILANARDLLLPKLLSGEL